MTEEEFLVEQTETMTYVEGGRLVSAHVEPVDPSRYLWSVLVSDQGVTKYFAGEATTKDGAKSCVEARLLDTYAGEGVYINWTFLTTRPGKVVNIDHLQ